MSIKILPARLANQIAAGEVVERPASVVKELVENSLDSGATRIDIDIEKGGSKLIRVRDNGKGIIKDELGLALSRHATSKIHSLDDLEAIVSLGFRGEALASISSVARLTMTSRPATQDQAWSAYSEGRDMAVKLQPTAHPIGTSVEVLDLFFNTPARRKFLRTEKTEFAHIDELLKRIALSRFDVTINIRHNGKMIRQYRAAKTDKQAEARISAVCGSAFVRHMLKIELEHQGLKLHGWVTTPEGARQQSDLQYCYVNGRMMRDKLINHAIRQSYENSLRPEQFATFVLFIELDPHQVDVNVHPAKHEVRFHQARLVHDFIYQALSDVLAQSEHIEPAQVRHSAYAQPSELNESHPPSVGNVGDHSLPPETPSTQPLQSTTERALNTIANNPSYPNKADHISEPRNSFNYQVDGDHDLSASNDFSARPPKWQSQENQGQRTTKGAPKHKAPEAPTKQQVRAYTDLLKVAPVQTGKINDAPTTNPVQDVEDGSNEPTLVKMTKLGKAIAVVSDHFLLLQSEQGPVLLDLYRAEWYRTLGQLSVRSEPLKAQPLLVPLAMKLEKALLMRAKTSMEFLARFGIQLREKGNDSIMVMTVPQPLRQQNLQQLLPDLLSYLNSNSEIFNEQIISSWLATRITTIKDVYTQSEALQLLSDVEHLWHGELPLQDTALVQLVDFTATMIAFDQ
ncbi:DNA mismatch repair endonuclease MutL [Vibrio tapetis]|uniref:DNA mismatch repair protein MutL n=1 Tax=Vibrio tapetis subsp. tapetis TaxID=1671868 RepID=A0A2N8ZFU4_9VIBR|nr:DNA mismatch repair endonuclease MutL [Vibrio tapetis]SON50781.1 methyl-directed mismatch repair protein [Vibrio tapetis subsp. tapetis]